MSNCAPSTFCTTRENIPNDGGDEAEHAPPPGAGRGEQQPQHPAVQEPGEPGRGVQEVQRRAGRRGVHHDQVPLVPGVQLTQLLHRHVLLGAGEGGAHGLVEGVGEDLRAPRRVGVREHDLVEGALHVQHHGVQLAAAGLDVDPLDPAGGVVQLGQAERLGQPAGRVDGEHHRAPAVPLGRPQRQRRRGGRLADPTGAAADHDPHAGVGEDSVHVQPGAAWSEGTNRAYRVRGVRAPGRRELCVNPPGGAIPANVASPARSTPSGSSGSSVTGRPSSASSVAERLLQLPPACWARASPCQPGHGRRVGRQPGGGQPAPQLRLGDLPGRSVSGGRAALTMIRPTGKPSCGQLGDRVHRLLDRHLLQQRHHVHRGHRGAQQRRHPLALGLDRADLGQPGGLGGDVEEAPDPAGRRGVQHHRVVHPALAGWSGWWPP